MKTQLDFLKEAVSLAENNPECKIRIASSNELCEDSSWTEHQITKVEKSLYYQNNESIFLNAYDVVEYFEVFRDKDITEEEAKKLMEFAIIIHTAP